MENALLDVAMTRAALRAARRQYHLALLIAEERGLTHEQIADTLETKPLYIGNTIRKHKEGKCGCS